MHGASFPGSPTLFIGANEHLGWTHTVNYPDLADVFELTMHPDGKLLYRFDGNWETLQMRRKWVWVKVLGFIKIPIRKTFYWSRHGPVIKNKRQYFAVRFPAIQDIRAAEQWYYMNKAKSFDEFNKALDMHAMPGLNLVYADRQDNIYYLSMGQFPYRNPACNWQQVVRGDTSAYLWNAREFFPIDSLPQVLNPDCGYLFDTNNSPFDATCGSENVQMECINPTMGFADNDNNRSLRMQELFDQYDLLSYDDFKPHQIRQAMESKHPPVYRYQYGRHLAFECW